MCPDCQDTGIRMVDIGTATIPDYVEVECYCIHPETRFDYPDFDCPVIDYDRTFNDALYTGL